jgi:hypothetical protein
MTLRVFQTSRRWTASNGRAEIMAGRGSFIESYPLFGQDLDDYDELFVEKLTLLLALRDSEVIRWTGVHRPSIDARGVYPRPLQQPLPVWIAVGGTPASVSARVARPAARRRDHRRRAGTVCPAGATLSRCGATGRPRSGHLAGEHQFTRIHL